MNLYFLALGTGLSLFCQQTFAGSVKQEPNAGLPAANKKAGLACPPNAPFGKKAFQEKIATFLDSTAQTDRKTQITGYSAGNGGIQGPDVSPSRVKPRSATFEKFLNGQSKFVMVAIPQDQRKKFYKQILRVPAIEDQYHRCIPFFAGDFYDSDSDGNGKLGKIDISHDNMTQIYKHNMRTAVYLIDLTKPQVKPIDPPNPVPPAAIAPQPAPVTPPAPPTPAPKKEEQATDKPTKEPEKIAIPTPSSNPIPPPAEKPANTPPVLDESF